MLALVVRRERHSDVPLVGLDALAREAGMHPDLVRRLVALGLACELLERIDELETRLRRFEPR